MATKESTEKKAETSSGIEMKTAFRPSDSPVDYARELNDPGEFPYTRGPYPSMSRGKLWTMRQYAGYASPAESNARYQTLLTNQPSLARGEIDHPPHTGAGS